MSGDLRSSVGFARVQHFRVFPHKLVPQFSTVVNESKSLNLTRFLYAPWLTGYNLFGYGVVSGGSFPAVYMKTGDIITSSWTTPSGGDASASGARNSSVFFHYKNYLYGFHGTNQLWRYGDLISGLTWTDTYQTVAFTNVAPPLHHPADDCAYFFADNKVYRLNNTTWDGLVLTLPDNMVITSAEADGDFLVIGCKSKSGLGNSISYHWDRDSSLSTVTSKTDWGRGDLVHLAKLDGNLVAVMDYYTTSAFGHSQGKLITKKAVGAQAVVLEEYPVSATSYFEANKFVTDEKLHFAAELARDGSYIHGVFSVNSNGRLTVAVSEADADGITAGLRYQGIYKTGEYWWIAHSNDGSVERSDDQANYTYTSLLETDIIGTADVQSQFVGATVSFEPLPSGATVTLKYRKVGETSWTTIKSINTAATTTLSATKDTNSQARVFNEVQYRIESTGGAVITGLEFTHETNDQKSYGRS
jgi:hypothetical protein